MSKKTQQDKLHDKHGLSRKTRSELPQPVLWPKRRGT